LDSLIIGAVSGVFSIVIFWCSRKYLNDRYRNKIIRVLFKKRIVKLENGQNIDIDLQFKLSFANFLKFLYNFTFFFISYIIFSSLLRIDKSPTYFLGFTIMFFICVAFIYVIFIFSLFYVTYATLRITKKKPNITKSPWYIFVKSTYFTPFDFIIGWMFFTYFFLLIYLGNFRIINSYWEPFFLYYLSISFIFLLLPSISIFSD